jgi:hypothetical protein
VAHERAKSAGRHLCSTRRFRGVEYSASGFTFARNCILVNLSSLNIMGSNPWRLPTVGLSLPESTGSIEVKNTKLPGRLRNGQVGLLLPYP